jgi:hypothetical protein
MLYKLLGHEGDFRKLEPLPFLGLDALGKLEKDLENLLSDHLFDILFEDATLMPMFCERRRQPEGDIYALKKNGDLVIFELKLGLAGAGAMIQILRYAQDAGQWSYDELERRYRIYSSQPNASLVDAHKEGFNLERSLLPGEFNQRQHLYVVGNAANDDLINAVDYWKRQSISVDFLPYRIYEAGGEWWFEFFALPYDRHQNPAATKGVLFDTNLSYSEDSLWEMMEKRRVAAYGGVKEAVECLRPKDIVFFSHKGFGLVAAAEVASKPKDDGPKEEYCDVKFLTAVPQRQTGIRKSMPFSQVSQVTGKSFYWARTVKVPYLSHKEAGHLLEELRKIVD